jgi:Family of unknown function (DUF6516)
MSALALKSLASYSQFIAEILSRPSVRRSTVALWSDSPWTGILEGEVYFDHGIRLRLREEVDFEAGLITAYGYEAYRNEERLFWYDDFPHPNDPTLASTFPHHKHVPPDIRNHRIPAPGMSFTIPNLSRLVEEIEAFRS